MALRRTFRFLFVHAHPDDETLSTGALILGLERAGHSCAVLTATRGERGEVVAGSLPHDADLVASRALERSRAIAALGAHDAGWLGETPNRQTGSLDRVYADSGMRWITETLAGPAPDAPADAFTRADPAEATDDLVAAIAALPRPLIFPEPELILVSYAADGGYGHPDHVRCHEITRAAAKRLSLPFAEITTDRTTTTAWYEAGDDLDRLREAHIAYPSQFTVVGDEIHHVGGQVDRMVVEAGLHFVEPCDE
ncbi:MAG: PIG-L family deacetylase [Propionibacteriaceae bacterium]|jgi:N-acetyl-1-D-myo-inositol-2-amino-2-deoxy-alpha-D-glucopyranoside deacetylase|nr:PIG-L family deacetylase [Propionibacteriaceae bacterium]